MNDNQFKFLCEQCDKILTDRTSSIQTIAIGWMHIINEHPINLSKYIGLFYQKQFSEVIIRVRSAIYTIVIACKSKKNLLGWNVSTDLPSTIDVLLVSHLLNKEQLGSDNDFYYGVLAEALNDKGVKCATLLWNQSGEEVPNLMGKWKSSATPRIMFDRTLSFFGELRLRNSLAAEARRLKKLALALPSEFDVNICNQASSEAMSTFSIANLRFYLQMHSLIKALNPKTILVTYEGHAWERLAFAAARNIDKNISCVGYQHTVIFKRQHAIKRSLGKNFDPDIIIGAGNGSIEALIEMASIGDAKTIVAGTHRFNKKNSASVLKFNTKSPPTCLVLPDGTMNECLLIFRFAVEAAKLNKEVIFILRMHPVLSFMQVIKRDSKFSILPPNVIVSDARIEDEFNQSRWVLYRGSSAAIHAVSHGLRPIYIAIPGELDIDPIYKLTEWKKVAFNPIELNAYIQEDLVTDDKLLTKESKSAIQYCEKYFSMIDYDIFVGELH